MPAFRSVLTLVLVAACAAPAVAGIYYTDSDGDGYGFPGSTIYADVQPPGTVTNNLDCDDTRPNVHPGAPEFCNGRDDDCDGAVDENVSAMLVYRDEDGDGYGQAAISSNACPIPAGYVVSGGDCDDLDPAINPGAVERCGNALDDDCDTQAEEDCGAPFVISEVVDVPGDDGHVLLVRWHGHPDDLTSGGQIVDYEIRRQPPGGAASPDTWDVVATVAATGLVGYEANLPTPCNDTPTTPCATTVAIRARGPLPGSFVDTAPGVGSALDNLAPGAPIGLDATYVPNYITLTWSPSPSADVAHYRVYRDSGCDLLPDCVPTLEATVSPLDELTFTGPFGERGFDGWVSYTVTAVDTAGHESPGVRPSLVGVEDGESALLVFASPAPNPSRGEVVFSWTMPSAEAARLTIVDLAGRTVRMLTSGTREAGPHRVSWDGRDARGQAVRPGAYFARLDTQWGSRSRMLVRVN